MKNGNFCSLFYSGVCVVFEDDSKGRKINSSQEQPGENLHARGISPPLFQSNDSFFSLIAYSSYFSFSPHENRQQLERKKKKNWITGNNL
jgi:hypothetical protein